MQKITYEALFVYLRKVGFRDVSTNRFERIFEHPVHKNVLAFSLHEDGDEDQIARPADMLSVEMQLQQTGLLERNLSEVLSQRVHRH